MPANIQIIRGSAPALQIGTSAVPPQTFTSHLPRGVLVLILSIHWTPCSFILKADVSLRLIHWRGLLLIRECFLNHRCCGSSGYVQLQNCPASSNRCKCGSRPAHIAAHNPPGHSGILHLQTRPCGIY